MELAVNGGKKEDEEEQEMGKKRMRASNKKSPKTQEERKGFIECCWNSMGISVREENPRTNANVKEARDGRRQMFGRPENLII